MFSMLRTTFASATKFIHSAEPLRSAQFHSLTPKPFLNDLFINPCSTPISSRLNAFLRPQNHSLLLPSCGFKVMGKVRRRCKDCYLVWREQRLYNLCKTHRRHKQMSMVKHERNTWILTHATQSKIRPY